MGDWSYRKKNKSTIGHNNLTKTHCVLLKSRDLMAGRWQLGPRIRDPHPDTCPRAVRNEVGAPTETRCRGLPLITTIVNRWNILRTVPVGLDSEIEETSKVWLPVRRRSHRHEDRRFPKSSDNETLQSPGKANHVKKRRTPPPYHSIPLQYKRVQWEFGTNYELPVRNILTLVSRGRRALGRKRGGVTHLRPPCQFCHLLV